MDNKEWLPARFSFIESSMVIEGDTKKNIIKGFFGRVPNSVAKAARLK